MSAGGLGAGVVGGLAGVRWGTPRSASSPRAGTLRVNPAAGILDVGENTITIGPPATPGNIGYNSYIASANAGVSFSAMAGVSAAEAAAWRAFVAPKVVDAWALRHTDITARLKEHLSHAVKQAKLTPAQARDVIKNGRASTHWGTQIDTRFKELVQNDPLLRGEVAVSPRPLPKGSGAPDVIDLRSKPGRSHVILP